MALGWHDSVLAVCLSRPKLAVVRPQQHLEKDQVEYGLVQVGDLPQPKTRSTRRTGRDSGATARCMPRQMPVGPFSRPRRDTPAAGFAGDGGACNSSAIGLKSPALGLGARAALACWIHPHTRLFARGEASRLVNVYAWSSFMASRSTFGGELPRGRSTCDFDSANMASA